MKRLSGVKYLAVIVFLMGLSLNTWAHTDVTPEEAKDMIDTNEGLIVVDVREEESEYCDPDPTPPVPPGHIPGALNYPWATGVLEDRYNELPIGGEILVLCRSGHRSDPAAAFLDSKGYLNVYDMLGGMSAWEWETVVCIDSDSDGANDDLDNCPYIYNDSQEDNDEDKVGNVCDNCPDDANSNQEDTDGDCIGNVCDPYPETYDPSQTDFDSDGVGDVCDNCHEGSNSNQEDGDEDDLGDICDNCPNAHNPVQEDTRPDVPNNCGDACECEGDLNGDGEVQGLDTIIYKAGYPRSYYLGVPCAVCIGGSNAGVKCLSDADCPGGDCGQNPTNPCVNDLNCDMEVGGLDTILYKDDYPRTEFLGEPCPPCSRGNYPCSYPE